MSAGEAGRVNGKGWRWGRVSPTMDDIARAARDVDVSVQAVNNAARALG